MRRDAFRVREIEYGFFAGLELDALMFRRQEA
jgi:hypothetical protein